VLVIQEVTTEKSKEFNTLLSVMPKEELIKLAKDIALFLKNKYSLSIHDIFEFDDTNFSDILVPITVFSTELSPSEAITKYLKEKYDLTFTEIGNQLKKEPSSIWASYKRATTKVSPDFKFQDSDVLLPISIFSNEEFSVLESISYFLREKKHMKMKKIAQLVNKSVSTMWSAYNRSKIKLGGSQ
jgi:hypothetical protein